MNSTNFLTLEKTLYAFYLCGAILNFLPQILGFSFVDEITNDYPDFLQKLSGFQYGASVVASLATTLPILLDYFFDLLLWCSEKLLHPNSLQNSSSEAPKINYIPFREVVFLLIIPDILMLCWIIPYEQYDYLPGLIGLRDTMYIYTFLVCMVKFQNPIWNQTTSILIGFPFMAANILGSCHVLSVDHSYMAVILPFLVALGLFAFLVTLARWFVYIHGLDLNLISLEESRKLLMCSIYAISYTIFILGDWLIYFAPQPINPDWSNVGANYLTMYTYLMAGCTLVITVITSRFARLEAEDSKSILSMKQMFMRYISHEIRTPLNTLFLGLKLLQDKITPTATEDTNAVLKDTQDSCSTAIEILNEMLLYDKIVGGLMTLEKVNSSPQEFVTKTINPFRSQAIEGGIVMNILTDITAEHRDLRLHADPFKVAQVVRNLTSNALKFTPRIGTVDVRLAVEDNADHSIKDLTANAPAIVSCWIRGWKKMLSLLISGGRSKYAAVENVTHWMVLTVKDSGAGMTAENQAKLFSGIIQFNPGKLQRGGGTGLGLFISKKIVDLHGGSLTVHSCGEGEGSTFTLRLPLLFVAPDVEAGLSSIEASEANIPEERDERVMWAQEIPTDPQLPDVAGTLFQPRTSFLGRDSITAKLSDDGPGQPARLPLAANCVAIEERSCLDETKKKKLRILVVDDSTMNRRMICRTLNGKDAVCDQAEDGAVAVEMIEKRMAEAQRRGDSDGEMFLVVVMDYQMPNMDGPTAIKAIRKLGYRGMIIGLTGNAMQCDQDTMLQAGADEVFAKPLDVNLFWATVQKRQISEE